MGKKKSSAGGITLPQERISDIAAMAERGSSAALGGVPETDDTLDALFEGRLKFYQSRSGYRVSLDAVLLAHFVKITAGDKIVDLGAGNGAIALMLAHFYPMTRLTALEIQPRMLARARRNAILNGLEMRITTLKGDVRALETLAEPENYDVAVCNPPYRSPLSGRVSPNAEKRIARHEFEGALKHFLQAGRHFLAPKGRMALVYPAFRCVDLLVSMRAAGFEPKRLRMVHSISGSEGSLVLVEGVKGGKSEIVVEPPLIVYDAASQYSAEVAAMLAGEAAP
ncbi:MAG: methyltransferase [Deltaproteobacteria bacterium]|nr:methyltransferase [Deltaproteobacteria bacterium]